MEGKMADTLYKRLGGYDAIAAVADDLLVRLQADPRLARFWQHRSEDSLHLDERRDRIGNRAQRPCHHDRVEYRIGGLEMFRRRSQQRHRNERIRVPVAR